MRPPDSRSGTVDDERSMLWLTKRRRGSIGETAELAERGERANHWVRRD